MHHEKFIILKIQVPTAENHSFFAILPFRGNSHEFNNKIGGGGLVVPKVFMK